MADEGFKITANESDFLTLVMWEAATTLAYDEESFAVRLEKDSVL